jgi:hypothetical protein
VANNPAPGTIVEVVESGKAVGEFAVVVKPSADVRLAEDCAGGRVWVRYDNGCEVPVREYNVRPLAMDQVLARLNGR